MIHSFPPSIIVAFIVSTYSDVYKSEELACIVFHCDELSNRLWLVNQPFLIINCIITFIANCIHLFHRLNMSSTSSNVLTQRLSSIEVNVTNLNHIVEESFKGIEKIHSMLEKSKDVGPQFDHQYFQITEHESHDYRLADDNQAEERIDGIIQKNLNFEDKYSPINPHLKSYPDIVACRYYMIRLPL